MARARCPRSTVEAGQKCVKIKGAWKSNIFRLKCRILKYSMRGLLQHWTKSFIIPSSKGESVWRNNRPRKRTVSFEVDRLPTWSTNNSGSLEPIILSKTTPTCSLLLFEMTIFRNSIRSGTEYYCLFTKIAHDDILEGLYKLRIRESDKLKTVLELYDLETHQKKLGPDYHRLKTVVKRSVEPEIRNKNCGARSGNFERNAVVKNQGTKQRVQRILGDCWQRETNGQCVNGDNCSFRHDVNKRWKVHHQIRLRILHAAEWAKIIEDPKSQRRKSQW